MDNEKMQGNQPIVPERSKVFDIVYMLVFVVLLGFLVYVKISFSIYSPFRQVKFQKI